MTSADPDHAPRSIGRAASLRVIGLLALVVVLVSALAGACGGEDRPETGVALVAGSERLGPTSQVETGSRPAVGEVLHVARGEREGVQLVLDGTLADEALRVAISTRGSGTVPRRARGIRSTVWREVAMRVREGSPEGEEGSYYDALDLVEPGGEAARQAAGRAVYWIDVEVDRDARPGPYRLVATARGASDRLAVVDLVVHEVQLPARPTLGSSIGVDESQVVRFEPSERGSAAWKASLQRYYQLLLDARLSPADLSVDPDVGEPGAEWEGGADDTRVATVYDDPATASIRIPFYQDFPFADPLGSDRGKARDYLRTVAATYRARGWLDRSYLYVFDEPGVEDAERTADVVRLAREADPGLRVLLTSEPRPEFEGAADIWVANVGERVRSDDVAREHAAGRDYWWYPSVTSIEPYPTLFIDDTRPSPRMLGWYAWRLDIDGILYWSATHWHEVEDPWHDPATYHDPSGAIANGDGSLIYPPRDGSVGGPSPSVRLLQLRDGIEEHDLLEVLAGRPGGNGRETAREIAEDLAGDLRSVPEGGAPIEQARIELLQALDE